MSTAKFLLRRSLHGIVVIWGAVTVLFTLRAVSPGDPARLILGQGSTAELRRQVREELGLNDPMHLQYLDYVQGLLAGDLGYSYQSSREVSAIIIDRIPATLELALAATVVAILFAIPLGVIAATRRNRPSDYGATMFSLLGISTPNFWLGLMLILLFAVWIGIFPTGRRAVGFVEAWQTLFTTGAPWELMQWVQYITLPALTLGTYFTALITRLTRSGMLDELGKPYVTATEAKGLPGPLIRYKHVLRNTMIPIVTVLGLQLGTLMGGAVITETVFNWPGLGLRLVDALGVRDWPIIQGIVLFVAVSFVVLNILVDGLYAYLDPQVGEG